MSLVYVQRVAQEYYLSWEISDITIEPCSSSLFSQLSILPESWVARTHRTDVSASSGTSPPEETLLLRFVPYKRPPSSDIVVISEEPMNTLRSCEGCYRDKWRNYECGAVQRLSVAL